MANAAISKLDNQLQAARSSVRVLPHAPADGGAFAVRCNDSGAAFHISGCVFEVHFFLPHHHAPMLTAINPSAATNFPVPVTAVKADRTTIHDGTLRGSDAPYV